MNDMKELIDFLYKHFIPKGVVDCFEIDLDSNSQRKRIKAPQDYDHFFEVYIHNKGDKPVYFKINGLSQGKYTDVDVKTPSISAGYTFNLSLITCVIYSIEVYTSPGDSSTVRICTVS